MLLEIGTEEIPARFIPGALQSLKLLTQERLNQSRLPWREMKTMGTPRRLALFVYGLPLSQPDKTESIIGPPKTAAFSEDGTPTKVALGFAKAKGVTVEELELIETPKGVYLGLRKTIPGFPTQGCIIRTPAPNNSGLAFSEVYALGEFFYSVRPSHSLDRGPPRRPGGAFFIRWDRLRQSEPWPSVYGPSSHNP